jgi:hypothetical protein
VKLHVDRLSALMVIAPQVVQVPLGGRRRIAARIAARSTTLGLRAVRGGRGRTSPTSSA